MWHTSRVAIGSMLTVFAVGALAQSDLDRYPIKPVRIITGAPGIFHDIVTRQLAQRLSERWGQPVVVENQPAAALTVGTGMAARATPDGYTLLMSDRSALAVAPHLYRKLGYDPLKDFAPITRVASTATLLVVHPSLSADSLPDFLRYAKAQPHPLQFATAGAGTNNHVAFELFKHATGIDAMPVHYKGGAQSGIAVVSGEVKAAFGAMAGMLPHVQAGRVKALLVTGRQRFAGAPDVATAAELGVPGLELEFWIGMLAPARTPAALVPRLNAEIGGAIHRPELAQTLFAQGAATATSTPAEFAAYIESESARMKRLIALTGMRID